MDAFPKPGRTETAEMQCAQLRQLRKVTDVLLALAHTSRQHKVRTFGTPIGIPIKYFTSHNHSGLMHSVSVAESTSLQSKCLQSPSTLPKTSAAAIYCDYFVDGFGPSMPHSDKMPSHAKGDLCSSSGGEPSTS